MAVQLTTCMQGLLQPASSMQTSYSNPTDLLAMSQRLLASSNAGGALSRAYGNGGSGDLNVGGALSRAYGNGGSGDLRASPSAAQLAVDIQASPRAPPMLSPFEQQVRQVVQCFKWCSVASVALNTAADSKVCDLVCLSAVSETIPASLHARRVASSRH